MALTDQSRRASAAPDLRRIGALAAGDLVAFLAFAAIGRRSHNEAAGISTLAQVAETAAPFAIGWFAIAPFAGAFRSAALGSPRAMLARTALAWLLAWPIGLGLRALIRQTSIPISFAIVTLITNMVILLGWRGIFAWLTARRKDI